MKRRRAFKDLVDQNKSEILRSKAYMRIIDIKIEKRHNVAQSDTRPGR